MEEPVLLGIDMDGVFNIVGIDNTDNTINKTTIYFLNKIIEAIPNCEVLITSSWGNMDNSTANILVNAGFKYPNRIVGNTGFSGDEYSRTIEINEWLSDAQKTDYYKHRVYLDDEIILFSYLDKLASRRDVVECRPDVGLNIDKAYETICRLQGIDLKFW